MIKSFAEMSILEKIQFICVFVPILSTSAWVIYEIAGPDQSPFIVGLTEVLLIVGLIGALVCIALTDILGFIKFAFSFVAKGWTIGMMICPIFPICFIVAFLGIAIAFALFAVICMMLPAALTIYFYFIRTKA